MMNFFRSLFGLSKAGSTRTVLGHSVEIELKDVKYIRSSKERLEALYHLYTRFHNTPHAPKLKKVYEKTKNIHNYLVGRNGLHELELFHLQHTDHFISAFTAILDAHRQKFEAAPPASAGSAEAVPEENYVESLLNNFKAEKFKDHWNGIREQTKVPRERASQGGIQTAEVESEIPSLAVPTVSINTFEKIPYFQDGHPAKAIGYTSTSQEKFEFQQHLMQKLEMENIKYMGNALVQVSNGVNAASASLLPIIHWKGFLYAVDLNDYRLFPVKTFRNRI